MGAVGRVHRGHRSTSESQEKRLGDGGSYHFPKLEGILRPDSQIAALFLLRLGSGRLVFLRPGRQGVSRPQALLRQEGPLSSEVVAAAGNVAAPASAHRRDLL